MKFIISLSLILLTFSASAATNLSNFETFSNTSVESAIYPGKGKKKNSRKNARIKRKRKRACSSWGRRSYAG